MASAIQGGRRDLKTRIYERGEIREVVDPVEASELEKASVWDLRHILERIQKQLPL